MSILKFINRAKAAIQAGVSYVGSINSSAKMIKNKKVSDNYTYVIYFAPYKLSGFNVCPDSTPECRAGCLHSSGRVKVEERAKKTVIQKARIIKTKLFFQQRDFLMRWIIAEMQSYQKKAKKDGYAFSARLNGTSDIAWENVLIDGKNIFDHFPNVQFYDYTKSFERMFSVNQQNYHLTFSYTGRNEAEAIQVLENNRNVAVIFNIKKGQPLPTTWNGFPVIDGDITDYRPNDGNGVVVGLRWKDIANKKNNDKIKNSCFVVQPTATVEI